VNTFEIFQTVFRNIGKQSQNGKSDKF